LRGAFDDGIVAQVVQKSKKKPRSEKIAG
jgi:hypothetical protein